MSVAQELARNRQLYLRRRGGAQTEALPVAAPPSPQFAGGITMAETQTAPVETRRAEPFVPAEAPRRFSLQNAPLPERPLENRNQKPPAFAEAAAPVFAGNTSFAEAVAAKNTAAVREVEFPDPPARGNRPPVENPLDAMLERLQMDARRYPADLDEGAR